MIRVPFTVIPYVNRHRGNGAQQRCNLRGKPRVFAENPAVRVYRCSIELDFVRSKPTEEKRTASSLPENFPSNEIPRSTFDPEPFRTFRAIDDALRGKVFRFGKSLNERHRAGLVGTLRSRYLRAILDRRSAKLLDRNIEHRPKRSKFQRSCNATVKKLRIEFRRTDRASKASKAFTLRVEATQCRFHRW